MFCAQCAIGVTNDYFDRELDAATKPWKPVAAGIVRPSVALLLAAAFAIAATIVATTLGLGGFMLAMLGMTCGLAYDVRLKGTAASALPYMVAIPVLPLWVWVTLGEWQSVLWWLVPLGALLGLALHLANTLPDLDDDRAHGVAGLAHRLGAARSLVLAWSSFAAALVASAILSAVIDYELRVYAAGARRWRRRAGDRARARTPCAGMGSPCSSDSVPFQSRRQCWLSDGSPPRRKRAPSRRCASARQRCYDQT